MIISVTQEHIDIANSLGRKDSFKTCPIVQALKSIFPYVRVHSKSIWLNRKGDKYNIAQINLSDYVNLFITNFDREYEVHPFNFEINDGYILS